LLVTRLYKVRQTRSLTALRQVKQQHFRIIHSG
jgi:hypothetical protein